MFLSLKDWIIRGEARRYLRLRIGPDPTEPMPAPGDLREPRDSSDTPSE